MKKVSLVISLSYDEENERHPSEWNWAELLDLPDEDLVCVLRSSDISDNSERIVVLNDNETFSSFMGASVHDIPSAWKIDDIESYLSSGTKEFFIGEVF